MRIMDNKTGGTWVNYFKKIIVRPYSENKDCLHNNCPSCNGSGVRVDGLGPCIHMISCPCPSCSPRIL